MLGLKSRFTPAGVLGMLLAGIGEQHLDNNECFARVLRAAKEAHREELLASAGSTF